MSKFSKYKSVDNQWLHIPLAYCLKTKGKYTNSGYNKINNSNNIINKDFCIIEIFGNKALCGWRNTQTCKMGMTRLYPIVTHNSKKCVKYKNQFIDLSTVATVF